MQLNPTAKVFFILGIVLILLGIVFQFWAPQVSALLSKVGKLPGDIAVERQGFKFYAPLGTSFIVSVLLSLILYLVARSGR